jgi:hypothetical protein
MIQHLVSFLCVFVLAAAAAGCGDGGGGDDVGVDPTVEETAEIPVETPDPVGDDPVEDDAAPDPAEDDAAGEPDGPVECGTGSIEALMACVDRERYVEDLTFVAQVRPPGSEHWQAVQDLCADRMTAMGFTVERHAYATGVNVIGKLEGSTAPAEEVLVSAHYDHLDDCEGADDNATGVAGLLETGRVLAQAGFGRTLILACWDEEEGGLIGSEAYATRADGAGEAIIVSYVYEMLGFKSDEPNSQTVPEGLEILFPDQVAWLEANEYRGDFIAVINDDLSHASAAGLTAYAGAVALPIITLELPSVLKNSSVVNDLRRSDHASFWLFDFPAMMIGDTAEFRNPYYHCAGGPDRVDTLDHDFAVQVIRATVGAAAADLGLI